MSPQPQAEAVARKKRSIYATHLEFITYSTVHNLQPGDLGFEPSSHASVSRSNDIGLTLENTKLKVVAIHAARIHIVVTLG